MIFIQQLMSLAFLMLLTTSFPIGKDRDVAILSGIVVGFGTTELAALNDATDNMNNRVDDLVADHNELLHQFTLAWDANGTIRHCDTRTIKIGNGTWCCVTSYRLVIEMQRTRTDRLLHLAEEYAESEVDRFLHLR